MNEKTLKQLANEALDALYLIEDKEGYKNNPIGKAINYIQKKYIRNQIETNKYMTSKGHAGRNTL